MVNTRTVSSFGVDNTPKQNTLRFDSLVTKVDPLAQFFVPKVKAPVQFVNFQVAEPPETPAAEAPAAPAAEAPAAPAAEAPATPAAEVPAAPAAEAPATPAPQVIKGDKGEPGTNGTNGIDGKDGKPGKPGRPGRPGINGTNGIDGKDGLPGPKGDRGPTADEAFLEQVAAEEAASIAAAKKLPAKRPSSTDLKAPIGDLLKRSTEEFNANNRVIGLAITTQLGNVLAEQKRGEASSANLEGIKKKHETQLAEHKASKMPDAKKIEALQAQIKKDVEAIAAAAAEHKTKLAAFTTARDEAIQAAKTGFAEAAKKAKVEDKKSPALDAALARREELLLQMQAQNAVNSSIAAKTINGKTPAEIATLVSDFAKKLGEDDQKQLRTVLEAPSDPTFYAKNNAAFAQIHSNSKLGNPDQLRIAQRDTDAILSALKQTPNAAVAGFSRGYFSTLGEVGPKLEAHVNETYPKLSASQRATILNGLYHEVARSIASTLPEAAKK